MFLNICYKSCKVRLFFWKNLGSPMYNITSFNLFKSSTGFQNSITLVIIQVRTSLVETSEWVRCRIDLKTVYYRGKCKMAKWHRSMRYMQYQMCSFSTGNPCLFIARIFQCKWKWCNISEICSLFMHIILE